MTRKEAQQHINMIWDWYKKETKKEKEPKIRIGDFIHYMLRGYYDIAGWPMMARAAVKRYEQGKHDLPCPSCCAEATAKNDRIKKMGRYGIEETARVREDSQYLGRGEYYCRYHKTRYTSSSFTGDE
jgi:hypothetical protein